MSLFAQPGSAGGYQPSSPFELRHASTHRPLLVVVPERRMLVIHGAGPRHAADFRMATDVLRAVGNLVRLAVIRDRGAQPLRSVLEVAWAIAPDLGSNEIVEALASRHPRWRQMMELPRSATDSAAEAAIDEARRAGGRDVSLVRLVRITEGPAVQILRVGAEEEAPAVVRLYSLLADMGVRAAGDLHELVLADAAMVGRARARSILRVPIADER